MAENERTITKRTRIDGVLVTPFQNDEDMDYIRFSKGKGKDRKWFVIPDDDLTDANIRGYVKNFESTWRRIVE